MDVSVDVVCGSVWVWCVYECGCGVDVSVDVVCGSVWIWCICQRGFGVFVGCAFGVFVGCGFGVSIRVELVCECGVSIDCHRVLHNPVPLTDLVSHYSWPFFVWVGVSLPVCSEGRGRGRGRTVGDQ